MSDAKAQSSKPHFVKYIYDSVHGHIGLTGLELQVIDTPVFQRLRRVKQLGPADMVYPGATHTRFAHSIGAMHVMEQFISNSQYNSIPIAENKDDWQRLRLAALLHDVGHYPFSHSLEVPVTEHLRGVNHEEYGKRIIRTFLGKELDTFTPKDVVDILDKRVINGVWSLLISSDFDVDKMDYLLRDAYHTGVAYGNVDVERLLRTMSFDEEGWVFRKPGPVFENFLLGRVHMYQAVYYHKTVVSFELMIERIYEKLAKQEVISTPDQVLKENDPYLLAKFDDDYVWQTMHSYRAAKRKAGKSNLTAALIELLLRRDPLSLAVWESGPGGQRTLPSGFVKVKETKYIDEVLSRLASRSKIMKEWIFPFVIPKPISILPDEAHVKVELNGKQMELTEYPSLTLTKAKDVRFYDGRIYTRSEFVKPIQTAFSKL